jgi:hypothetical protein
MKSWPDEQRMICAYFGLGEWSMLLSIGCVCRTPLSSLQIEVKERRVRVDEAMHATRAAVIDRAPQKSMPPVPPSLNSLSSRAVQRHGCAGTGDAQHALIFYAKHEVAACGGDVAHVSYPVSRRSPTARTSGGIAVINFR